MSSADAGIILYKCRRSLATTIAESIRAKASLTGCAAKIPLIPQKAGKIKINGIRSKICLKSVMTIEGIGFAIDWKNVGISAVFA